MHSDGSCIRGGTPSAQASIGVYFGPNSRHNIAEFVPPGFVQTSEVAELWAALRALDKGRDVLQDVGAEGIVLASDAKCVCKGMTERIHTWRKQGFCNAHGNPIRHDRLFRGLSDAVDQLKRDKKSALFCKINRKFNKGADRLAGNMHKRETRR